MRSGRSLSEGRTGVLVTVSNECEWLFMAGRPYNSVKSLGRGRRHRAASFDPIPPVTLSGAQRPVTESPGHPSRLLGDSSSAIPAIRSCCYFAAWEGWQLSSDFRPSAASASASRSPLVGQMGGLRSLADRRAYGPDDGDDGQAKNAAHDQCVKAVNCQNIASPKKRGFTLLITSAVSRLRPDSESTDGSGFPHLA